MAPPAAARNFQQHQPITTALRQICESYPAGTCLRELLQNADDAEATEIEYVLDTNTYKEGPLLYDGLQQFQGPALLARNNKTFSDKDFASLSSIGDSRKRHDAAATGKFGQGFNSCYHWTDGPWIYSRNWLLLLDPHETWSIPTGRPGGPTWDVVENKGSEELQNHLATFKAFSIDTSVPLDGTIIRIPLRTKEQASESKIVQKEVTVQNIKDALALLGKEVRQGGLLFLKHVRKMRVRVDGQVMWEARMEERDLGHPSVRSELTADFKALYVLQEPTNSPQKISKSFLIDMSYQEGEETVSTPYLVHHLMHKSSGNKDLDNWARSKKLFPWVAIGAPLKESSTTEPFNGRLFSILRLPLETSQPVHVHGLWSITPDRGRLSSSGQTPGYEDMEIKWNTFMFEVCVAEAWAALLASRNTVSWKEERFSLWPRVESSPTELWTKLDNFVLRRIFSENLNVWNTEHCCVAATEGLFSSTDGEVATIYLQALNGILLPAVYLKPSLLEKAQLFANQFSRPLQYVSPGNVRSHLHQKNSAIPDNVSSLVLEYSLLDALQGIPTKSARQAIYEEMRPVPLWPTVQGSLRDLGHCTLMVPRNTEELTLFGPSRRDITIDTEKLSKKVETTFVKDVALGVCAFARLRTMADLGSDWPYIYQNPGVQDTSTRESRQRSVNDDPLIKRVWSWIAMRFKDERKLAPQLHDLWLLPVKGQHIRQCMPGSESRTLLIAEPTDLLYGLMDLDSLPSNELTVSAQILECPLLTPHAVELLRQQVRHSSVLNAASSCDLGSLLNWLATNVALVLRMPEAQKKKLLQELEGLARSKWPNTLSLTNDSTFAEIARLLKHLPLFSRQSADAPFKNWAMMRSDMLADRFAVPMPRDLPPICAIQDVGFYANSEPSEQYLLDTFKLFTDMNLETLLFQHILPPILESPSPGLEVLMAPLAKFTLDNSRRPSQSWVKQMKRFSIIPLQSSDAKQPQQYGRLETVIDRKSSLAKLYFDTESVWVERAFFEKHQHALAACGLPSVVTAHVVVERASSYSGCDDLEQLLPKVRSLLAMSIDLSMPSLKSSLMKIVDLPWLPVKRYSEQSLSLLPPSQCRGQDEAAFVDCILGVFDSRVAKPWKHLFGWNKPIDSEILSAQLDMCLVKRRHDQVDAVLKYIHQEYGLDLLRSKQCILSKGRRYVFPDRVFLPGSILGRFSLSPHLEEIDEDFAEIHSDILRSLKVRLQPNMDDILDIQNTVFTTTEGSLKDDAQLELVIRSLEVASRLHEGKALAQCKAPDTQRKLMQLEDLVHGDRSIGAHTNILHFVNTALSTELIERLGIESVSDRIIRDQIEIDDDDDDEYVPSERLTTIIEDTLGRYPILSTFSEFLANAEDCHASEISWILDRCEAGPYVSDLLLNSDMKALQGPALFAHNDKTFTELDFEGYKDIGRGGKLEDVGSIGLFGRGSMSMYHFTDTPMILSDKWLLIVDPRQQLLPRTKYGKRKVGIKLLLETVRRLSADLLKPFDGLGSFSMEADTYQGTLFRLPLKGGSSKNQAISGVRVEELFQEYYQVARESLLFLRHVHTISYHIRGNAESGWSISAKHTEESEEEVFQHIKLSGLQKGELDFEETWRVGLHDLVKAPPKISRPAVSKLKIVECGVAACLSHEKAKSSDAGSIRERGKFYNKLPTTYSTQSPVALHATFAVTGDRRSISVDDGRDPNAPWNHWLLDTCIPEFYIEFLKDLAPRLGSASFDFWPSKSSSGIAGVVQVSFWEKVLTSHYKHYPLYPLVDVPILSSRSTSLQSRSTGRRRLNSVVPLEGAVFDFLPTKVSSTLLPLLATLCPGLVRPPFQLRRNLMDSKAEITSLDWTYLSQLFRDEDNCRCLEEFIAGLPTMESGNFKTKALEMLLLELVPYVAGEDKTSLHPVAGCRVLPRLDGSLTLLRCNNKSVPLPAEHWVLAPTKEELSIFDFAPEVFVDTKLFDGNQETTTTVGTVSAGTVSAPRRNVLKELQSAGFNIRSMSLQDIGKLVMHPKSPLRDSQGSSPKGDWFSCFWNYLNNRITESAGDRSVSTFLSATGLQNCRIYRVRSGNAWQYLTPSELAAQPYIIQPADAEHARVCAEIRTLKYVERNHIPFFWASAERNFSQAPALTRLFSALQKIGDTSGTSLTTLLKTALSDESIEILRNLVLDSTSDGNPLQGQKALRDIQLWPRNTDTLTGSRTRYLAAKDAKFCAHRELLVPWTRDKDLFVDPDFVRLNGSALACLGIQLASPATMWKEYIEKNLPKKLEADSFGRYHRLMTSLNIHCVPSSAKVAPNGNGLLCSPRSLYDHNEELFVSAFRDAHQQAVKFIDPEFRDLRAYWTSLGLRTRNSDVITAEDYLDCVRAIDARSRQIPVDTNFSTDTEKIAGYLTYDKQCLRTWPSKNWSEISSVKMFIVQAISSQDGLYRRGRLRELSQTSAHCCLRDAGMMSLRRVLWSQLPFLSNPPADYVYTQVADCANPPAITVYKHLTYLVGICGQVQRGDVAEYLRDVQECYAFLQNNLPATKVISGIKAADIWLNLDTTEVENVLPQQLAANIMSADRLCMNSVAEPEGYSNALKFLSPYEKLLKALGVQALIIRNVKKRANDETYSSPAEFLVENFKRLRSQSKMFDVVFSARDGSGSEIWREVSAHKYALAGVSKYCETQFSGPWNALLANGQKIVIEDIAHKTLNCMVEFAYTGSRDWVPLTPTSDPQAIADRIDELLDLLQGSDMWIIPRLHAITEEHFLTYFHTYVRADNVEAVLEQVKAVRANYLVEACKTLRDENLEFVQRFREGNVEGNA